MYFFFFYCFKYIIVLIFVDFFSFLENIFLYSRRIFQFFLFMRNVIFPRKKFDFSAHDFSIFWFHEKTHFYPKKIRPSFFNILNSFNILIILNFLTISNYSELSDNLNFLTILNFHNIPNRFHN